MAAVSPAGRERVTVLVPSQVMEEAGRGDAFLLLREGQLLAQATLVGREQARARMRYELPERGTSYCVGAASPSWVLIRKPSIVRRNSRGCSSHGKWPQ